ncbi:MAG: OmpA family protein [Cryomorphaceae bacterium]|nr:OmpA family protein [Cryomorphaceae bacterium]
MRYLLCIAFLSTLSTIAQETFEIQKVEIKGVSGPVIANGVDSSAMFISVPEGNTLFTDDHQTNGVYLRIKRTERGATWSNFEAPEIIFPPVGAGDEGGIACNRKNDKVYFTAAMGGKWGGHSILFESDRDGKNAQILPVNQENSSIIHPFLTAAGDQLFFASNRQGGHGKYDIYYMNALPGGWSEPIRLKGEVNSTYNEISPSIRNGDLWFASDRPGKGKLDLYFSERLSQWTNALPASFNSTADELNCYWLTKDVGLLTSNTEGKDAIYKVSAKSNTPLLTGLTALLECAGTPVEFATVSMYNDLNERILFSSTGNDGAFVLGDLEPKKSYKVKFEDAPAEVLAKSLLYILDDQGKRIMVFSPGKNGWYLLELLPMEDLEPLQFVDNEDKSSLLNIAIEGQVFEETPGDIGDGETISILDESGQVMALAYTTDLGKFRFDELSPDATYTFKLDADSEALRMVIIDKGQEVAIPIENGKAIYERINAEDRVNLNDENGNPIVIRKNDVFIIQNIYYELNSSYLTAEAKRQLDDLGQILKNNPRIAIELSSHTDARGESEYNLDLSMKRANSAVAYLHANGIEAERMSTKGYGEEKLLNHCADGVECQEEEHAMNRRTEIRVITN